MRRHPRRIIRLRLEDQYVVDAAGFWLDRYFYQRDIQLGRPCSTAKQTPKSPTSKPAANYASAIAS